MFSTKELEETKKGRCSVCFSFSYLQCRQNPRILRKCKTHYTDALYQKINRNGRREVLERSYLTVKETDVTPVVNKSHTIVRWNFIVRREAKSVDGKTSSTEEWYLVGLRKVDGEWKVEDVRKSMSQINEPNGYETEGSSALLSTTNRAGMQ